MAHKIISGTYRDYLFLFGDSRTKDSDSCVRIAAAGKNFYIMLEDNFPAGYICANFTDGRYVVYYAYAQDSGVVAELVKYLNQREPVLVYFTERDENFDLIEGACNSLKIFEHRVLCYFRADLETFRRWKENYFDKFMAERGHLYVEYFSRRNFEICSFSEVPPKYLEQLYHSQENFFGNEFDVKPFLNGDDKNSVDLELSFVLVKDDKLAAYWLTLSPDGKNVTVEQIAVAKKYLNSGVMLPLWIKFCYVLYERRCENFLFDIYLDNFPMLKCSVQTFGKINFNVSLAHEYFFRKFDGENSTR